MLVKETMFVGTTGKRLKKTQGIPKIERKLQRAGKAQDDECVRAVIQLCAVDWLTWKRSDSACSSDVRGNSFQNCLMTS